MSFTWRVRRWGLEGFLSVTSRSSADTNLSGRIRQKWLKLRRIKCFMKGETGLIQDIPGYSCPPGCGSEWWRRVSQWCPPTAAEHSTPRTPEWGTTSSLVRKIEATIREGQRRSPKNDFFHNLKWTKDGRLSRNAANNLIFLRKVFYFPAESNLGFFP